MSRVSVQSCICFMVVNKTALLVQLNSKFFLQRLWFVQLIFSVRNQQTVEKKLKKKPSKVFAKCSLPSDDTLLL